MSPEVGVDAKIGKYELREIVGRGNMGTVFRAYDPFSNQDVAIKVCSTGKSDSDPQRRLYRRLFFNEAHTAGALDHPNILSVLDAGEESGEPYIVMEYVSLGATLKDFCNPESLLPIPRVTELIYHCAKALDYAHRRGVVHRDIKPSNLMLTADGTVKIGDFGIAQGGTSDTTQVLGVIGSPKYMSPEQAKEQDVTNQSDLYSLGVVLYELLTGKSPYAAQSLAGLIRAIVSAAPTDIRELRSDLPEALARIVDKALCKDPTGRYAMGYQMAADLAALCDNLHDGHDVSDDAKFAKVRQLGFFNDFSDAELWEVIRACLWQRYPAGTQIIAEGGIEHSFFILVAGSVSVLIGPSQITQLVSGDCFGEMGYLSKAKRSASIMADEDVSLLKINSSLMERASLACQLRFNKQFLQTLIGRLARTSEKLSQR